MGSRTSKQTTEQYHRIDIRVLHRKGYLRPGCRFVIESTREGDDHGVIDGCAGRDDLVLLGVSAGPGDHPPGQIVRFTWTRCNYGGVRPWFICPTVHCSRRVAILFDGHGSFACRRCFKLAYISQRLTIDRQALRRAQLVRIGAASSRRRKEDFAGRPKGMHRRTYELLRRQAEQMGLPPRIWRIFEKSSAAGTGVWQSNNS
jgi:hypothetical protein